MIRSIRAIKPTASHAGLPGYKPKAILGGDELVTKEKINIFNQDSNKFPLAQIGYGEEVKK